MHELGVVFHIIDMLQEVATENHVPRISKVTLELGEVSTVIPSYLTNCWNWAIKKHEFLTDSELVIEIIPAVTYCEDCGREYGTVAYGKICPHCGSEHTYLLRGNEFNVKEIEVPEDEPASLAGSEIAAGTDDHDAPRATAAASRVPEGGNHE